MIEEYVTNLGGKINTRLPYWNSSDDNPRLISNSFNIPVSKGTLLVECHIQKSSDWPDYPCFGDVFKNKFSVSLFAKKDDKTIIIPIVSLVEINQENLDKFLGQFRESP